jgi:hypothetical protein
MTAPMIMAIGSGIPGLSAALEASNRLIITSSCQSGGRKPSRQMFS